MAVAVDREVARAFQARERAVDVARAFQARERAVDVARAFQVRDVWIAVCHVLGVAQRRPPRLSNDCYRGFGRYFLTICTAERRQRFTSDDAVDVVKSDLLRTARDYRFDVTAYCFMGDHLHGLFESLAEDSDFAKFVKMFKQRTAFQHKRSRGGKLWQDGFFDRILRTNESVLDVVAYIIGNPVKAGLCKEPRQYPYSGSSVYSLDVLCDAVASRPSGVWRA